MTPEEIAIGLANEGRISVQIPQIWFGISMEEAAETEKIWKELLTAGLMCEVHGSMKARQNKQSRVCREPNCRKSTYYALTPKGIETFAEPIMRAANKSGRLIAPLTLDEVKLVLRKDYRDMTNEEASG